MPDDTPHAINDAMRELTSTLLTDTSFEGVLERASIIVKRTVPGADEVSVTVQQGRPTTVAASGPLAIEVDESQYAAGYGPCLDAIRHNETFIVRNQATETRWPEYTTQAFEAGVRSSLSLPLLIEGTPLGAFNIYSREVDAFDEPTVALADALSEYAAIVLNNAGLYYSAASRADQMAEAMRSRAVIEQAKGIVMGSRRCDADTAFQVLVDLSQRTGRKLHIVAQALVDEATRAAPG